MIRETSLPLRHAGSRLTFTPEGRGIGVEWTSRFEITMSVIGGLLGIRARRIYEASFRDLLLLAAKERLEEAPMPVGGVEVTQEAATKPARKPADGF